jgi:methionine-rich copper-binding protein CopC
MKHKWLTAIAVIGSLALCTPALAHDQLIDIEPRAGAVLESGSFQMTLTFNNPLLVIEGQVNAEVSTSPAGSDSWTSHEIQITDRILKAQINLTEPGSYDLRWRVVSSDGHPIDGVSNFSVEIPTTIDEPDSVIAPNPTTETPEPTSSLTGFYIGLAMVVLGAIFAPIGLLMRRRAKRSGV